MSYDPDAAPFQAEWLAKSKRVKPSASAKIASKPAPERKAPAKG